MSVIAAPPGLDALPPFDDGWILGDGRREPFLRYAEAESVNWSDGLEALHAESSRTHFLDVWTRDAIVQRVADVPADAVVLDLGCSTGFLLEELRAALPDAVLFGVDLVAAGLLKAHSSTPTARLLQADACELPLRNETVEAVVTTNLLEHVPDDRRALAEIRRVLRRGARAVIVVPAGPGTYDYYDRFLGHERRYGRGELAGKAVNAGLEVVEDSYIASLIYPAFWAVKQRNRRRYGGLDAGALEARVRRDIETTHDSWVGRALRRLEERLGIDLPFGIRNLVVLRRGGR